MTTRPRQFTERRGRPAQPPVWRTSAQLDIDQRCIACKAGSHRACVSLSCPCAENDHQEDPDA